MPAHIERLVERLDEYRFALDHQAVKSLQGGRLSPATDHCYLLQLPTTATYYSYLNRYLLLLSTISISYCRRDTTSDAREPAAL